jgi:hypothetical protein
VKKISKGAMGRRKQKIRTNLPPTYSRVEKTLTIPTSLPLQI